MKILVKFPTRGRWEKFSQVLYKYQMLRSTEDVHFLITIDSDDRNMNNKKVIDNIMQWHNVTINVIAPSGKIGAINSHIDTYIDEYDIILLASDDMIPQVKGYDQIIIDKMQQHYPDTDGILFFNDGFTGRRLNTLCILGKKYYKRFGYIYHPSYKSLWCDNEFMDVGFILGKQTFFDEVIIQHEHPANVSRYPDNLAKLDQLHHRDNNNIKTDELNYHIRKERNFDLTFNSDPDTGREKGNVQQNNIGTKPANRRGRPRKQSADL